MTFSPSFVVKTAGILLACAALCQCGPKPKPAGDAGAPAVTFHYDVALSFTPAAAAKLKTMGQKAEVSGYYFGAPNDAGKEKVNEAGDIELGENLIDVDAADQTVPIVANIDAKALAAVEGGQPSVLVSAWLAPTAGVANVLKCTTFKGTGAEAGTKPVDIHCDLK